MCQHKVVLLWLSLSVARDVSSRQARSLRGGDRQARTLDKDKDGVGAYGNDRNGSVRSVALQNEEPPVILLQENMSIDVQVDAFIVEEIEELRRRNVNLHRAVAQTRLQAGGRRARGIGPVVAEFNVIYGLYVLLGLCTLVYLVCECYGRRDPPAPGRRRGRTDRSQEETELIARDVITGTAPVASRIGLNVAPSSGPREAGRNNRADREAFERHRVDVAIGMLTRATPIFVVVVCLGLALWVCNITITIVGWIVLLRHQEQPCDQPLQWWLLAALTIQMVQTLFEPSINTNPRLQKLNLIATPLVTMAGMIMYCLCQTCDDTNPQLYRFVRLFMINQILRSAFLFLTTFLLLGLIFWMAQRGLLDDAQAVAASPNLIKELQTVEFDRAAFLDDSGAPRTCCICFEEFDAEKTIKRTPCQHDFHEDCLGDWLKRSAACPLCRIDLDEAVYGTDDVKEDVSDEVDVNVGDGPTAAAGGASRVDP